MPLDGDFNFDEIQKESLNSSVLYSRDSLIRASFEDFELLSIIGRGTFGKVYLVREKRNKKLLAMKVIRKDIVIQHQ